MLIKLRGECFMMCLDIKLSPCPLSDSFVNVLFVNKTGMERAPSSIEWGFLKEIQMKCDKKKRG